MRRKTLFAALGVGCALFLAISAQLAHAWSALGHQKIAALSWQHLTPDTRLWVTQILRELPPCMQSVQNANPEAGFIRLSVWPDLVGHQAACAHHARPTWHYRNLYWSPDQTPLPEAPTETDIVNELTRLIHSEGPMTAVELAWLIHLVADVHQPLHLSNRVSAQSPRGDSGGNRFPLSAPCRRCPQKSIDNLHQYWDRLLEQEEEDSFRSNHITALQESIQSVERRYRRELDATPLQSRAPALWAQNSHRLALEFAYPATLKKRGWPNQAYQQQARAVAGQQAVLAAYRLADVLNRWRAQPNAAPRPQSPRH